MKYQDRSLWDKPKLSLFERGLVIACVASLLFFIFVLPAISYFFPSALAWTVQAPEPALRPVQAKPWTPPVSDTIQGTSDIPKAPPTLLLTHKVKAVEIHRLTTIRYILDDGK